MWKLVGVILLCVTANVFALFAGMHIGTKKGLDSYHEMCYNSGPGIVIDEDTRTVVVCGPLTNIPEEEYNRYKDRI